MSGGRDWTTGEVRRLYEMRAKRARARDIASELGRTVDAVNSFLRYVPSFRERPAEHKRIERPLMEPPLEISPSEQLRIATLKAIMAYAHERGVCVDRAAQRLLYARAA